MADDNLTRMFGEFKANVSAELADQRQMFGDFKASVSAELADARQTFREFKESVSADLADQHRRLDEFADEVRTRIGTAETAIVNEIRSLASRFDLRLGRIESRLTGIESGR